MKKLNLIPLLIVVFALSISACGESEAERVAREQARLDSLRQVEQQKIDAQMKVYQDSVDAAQQPIEEMEVVMNSEISETGSYVVQVGAWRSEEKAQKFVAEWEDRNYPSSYVIKVGNEATGDVWFRVRVGYFQTQAAAEVFGTDLAKDLNSGFWIANKDS